MAEVTRREVALMLAEMDITTILERVKQLDRLLVRAGLDELRDSLGQVQELSVIIAKRIILANTPSVRRPEGGS